MKKLHGLILVLPFLAACKSASTPSNNGDAGPIVEAGVAAVDGLCSLIEGTDNDGTYRSICATAEEIAQVIAFILTLKTRDAGVPAQCSPLPNTTFCATSVERARAVLFINAKREVRLQRDGGT